MKNYEKMMEEYSKNTNEQTRRAFTFRDYGDIVKFAEDKHPCPDGGVYIVRTYPALLACIAFQIGYASALRKVKADGRKRRRMKVAE